MTPSNGIGATWLLQKRPSLLQTMDLARSKETLGKKQAFSPALARGGNY